MSLDINLGNIGESLNRKADLDLGNLEIGEEFKQSIEDAGVTFVKETYKDGNNWYRVWSDGFIEQGGRGNTANSTVTITLMKPHCDTGYSVCAGCNTSGAYASACACNIVSTTQIQLRCGGTTEWMWQTSGY